MNRQLLAETAALAGEIMLRSGAETFRVEDTMGHILRKANGAQVTPLALTTSILVTLEETGKEPISIVRRVHSGSSNLSNIVQVNEISRQFCQDTISLEEANEKLHQIKGREYRPVWYNLATIGCVSGFVLFFGGGMTDFIAGLLIGIVLALVITLAKKGKVSGFVQNSIASAVIALFAMALRHWILPDMNLDIVIISAIMPMVPGVAITNAVRDTLQGDYISGGARASEAFVIAVAIAVGAGLGMSLFEFIV